MPLSICNGISFHLCQKKKGGKLKPVKIMFPSSPPFREMLMSTPFWMGDNEETRLENLLLEPDFNEIKGDIGRFYAYVLPVSFI